MTGTSYDPAKDGWEVVALSGFTELIGPLWFRQGADGPLYALLVADKHANRSGFMHGGALAALLDNALGYASYTAIGGRKQATVTLDIQYLAPVPVGAFLIATPEVVKITRSLTFLRGTARVGDEVYATAQGTWKILRS